MCCRDADADAVVGDGDLDFHLAEAPGRKNDRAAARRELDRVGKQIEQDLLERQFIRNDRSSPASMR